MNNKLYTSIASGFIGRVILIAIMAVTFANNSFAQLNGIIAIPSANYPTIKVAVDSLNLYGVAGGGGVTFNVAAGYIETLTTRLNMTATGTIADPIVFQKSGAGANPIITSYAGTALASAAAPDGMWALVGSDYVTIDGINLQDAVGNTTTALQMEYGYGLFKASGTDGANNNTIKNCVITLNRNNTVVAGVGFITGGTGGSMGIVVAACAPTTGTAVTVVTTASGASSNNKFYSNTIQNVNVGIALTGYAGSTPFTLCDFNNDIGGTSVSTGNNIINFGGGTTPASACAAVYFSNQWSLNFSYNTVNNNNGSGINHGASQRGIWAYASSVGASATISNNNITIQGGTVTSSIDWVIDCEMAQSGAAGNTISISNNTISATKSVAATAAFTAIWVNSAASTVNINGNTITNFTYAGTGVSECILSQLAGIGTLNITNNNFSGISLTGATGSHYNIGVTATIVTALNINGNITNGVTLTGATSKIWRGVYISTAAATCAHTINSNTFQNISYSGGTPTGEFEFIYALGSPASWTINSNLLIGSLSIPTTGTMYFIYNSQSTSLGTVSNNNLTGTGVTRTGASGATYGYYNASSPTGTFTFSGNTYSNFTTSGSGLFYGIYLLTSTSCRQLVQNNTYSNISVGSGTLYGINHNYGNTGSEISGNIVSGLTGTGIVAGINIGATASITMDVFNNTVSGITTTGATSTVTGIIHAAGTLTNIYRNKVYNINANSTGSTAIGISVTAATTVSLSNNLIGDIKTNAALTGVNQIIGINVTAGTTVSASYNTINLNATTVGGANFGSSAISVNATPTTFTLRNNIFVNNSTPTGTGLAVAYRRASTALTNYSASSNNNLFYAGTPSANNLIFYDGTNSDQTVMAFKIRVFPADANSGTENPTFLSTVGANANFLHIDPSVATNVESGAANIAGITDDFDSEIRQGNGGYVGTGTAPDIGADEFGGIVAAALAPPINFAYNTATTSSFNITWDDNSVGEAGFVVFRSLNIGGPFNTIVGAVTSTTPGTTGTTYTLAQSSLLGGTTYYYQVVANNFTSSAPLSGNATTLSCGGGYAGTYTIPGSPFPGIKEALDSLVLYGMSGPVILELDPTYVGAGETYPLLINNLIGCLNPTNTLTIRPSAAVATPLIITSANTTATIEINGANFVTIDGRPGGLGSNKYLIIENTSTTAASAGNAILLRNEASNNTITYCDVRSANANIPTNGALTTVGAIPGAIAIGTTSGGFGNDNNIISFCDVHSLASGGNLGACIYSGNSTVAGSNANNDLNTIDNCNIFDFYLPTSASAGIDIAAGNNNWTITNNRVYQQSALSYAAGTQAVRGIWITPNTGSLTSASGFTISGNYIGGNASNGTGTYTMTGTGNYTFRGMDISVGTGVATSIQNNTLTNWNITGAYTGNSVYGIDVANGNVNIGTINGNLIGSTTTNGSITVTTTVSGGSMIGLRSGAGGTINFSNNTIGGIDMVGNATTIATGFNGIAGSGGANIIVNNNTVGSATLANSINMVATSATSTTAAAVRGIICNSGTAGTNSTVTNNLVANINSNYSGTGSQANTLVGISVTTGTSLVSGNTVRNLSSNTQTTSGGGTAAIVGIAYTSTTAPAVISNNTIHTLKLTHPATTAATTNQAIFYGGPTTGTNNVIERNFIHSLSIASPTNAAGIISGMDVGSGLVTIKNNMIRLGLDETGASIVSPCLIRGISKNSATSSIYFNSIYIGGTGVDVTATNTFALVRTGTAVDDWRNNVLVNERSNATTGGKHYAINLNATTTLTLNYNDYYGSGTGYVFGAIGVTDFAAYATNWVTGDANSYNLDPLFINPTGTSVTVDLHIDPVNATIIEGTGIPIGSVTNDFDNQTRASLTPTDMGADAGNFVNLLCNGNPPNSTAIIVGDASALCLTGAKTMTLSGFAASPGMTYQWQQSLVQGGPYTDVTSGTGGTAITYTTPTLTQTTYYVCVVTCSNGGAFTPSSELTVVVNNPQILSAPPVTRCGTGTVTLCATGSAGTTINWYSAASGGSPLTSAYSNIPVTGFNNDIVAGGVGTNSILGTTYSFGADGAGYFFIDNTFKYVSTNALPTCYMPVNKLAPSQQTPGLTYEFQDYGVGATLNDNALSIANQSTGYTSPLPSSGTLTLAVPSSYANLKVLYESVVNTSPLTVDATVTFTDATTQVFAGNSCVNWFTATAPAFSGMGRTTPAGVIQCGATPNMFELSLPISAGNQSKLVQSITFSIPTVLSGTFPYNLNYFHAMAVGGNPSSVPGCYTTPIISSNTTYYVSASAGGGGTAYVGKSGIESTASNGGGLTTYVNFDALSNFTLKTVDLFPYGTGAGTVTIELRTSTGTPIMNQTFNVTGSTSTASPAQTVTLNFPITPGSYRLGVNSWTGGVTNLFRDNTGTYPYTLPGVVSITGTSLAPYYYFFYNWGISTGCESGRTSVLATVTAPPAFAITPSQAVCNNAIAMLNVTSPSANYDSITWAPIANLFTDVAATIPYTGGNEDTVYFRSATHSANTITSTGNNTLAPFCSNITTSTVNVQPAAASVTLSSPSLCYSGSVVLGLSPASPYAPGSIQWQVSADSVTFTDIGGATNGTYTTPVIDTTTYYRAIIKNSNGDTCFYSDATVTVNEPAILTTTGASSCTPASLSLGATATAGATINWYATATGGISLGSGPSYNTPVISNTTTYYAAASNGGSSASTGMAAALPTATSGAGTTAFGLVFDALSAFTLNSVTIYPVSATSAAGTVTIDVINSSSVVLNTITVNVVGSPGGAVAQVVNCNFNIAPGTNLKMRPGFTGISGLLFEPSASAPSGNYGYPYVVPGILSINTSTLTAAPTNTPRNDLYYYFYNWNIATGCEGPRVPVVAAISTVPTSITTVTNPVVTCTPGQPVTLSVASSNGVLAAGGSWEYQWMDETGTTVLQAWSASSNFTVTAVSGLNKYRIYMRNSACPSSEGFDYASFVVGITGSVTGVSPTGCSPTGSIIVSAQGSGILTTWYNNDFTSSTLGAAAAVTGSASVTGGQCVITPNTTSQSGAFQVLNPGAFSASNYSIDFDLSVLPSGADGISYSFGDDVSPTSTTPSFESGTGTKLKLTFDAYPNTGGNVPGIYLMYNCNVDLQPPTAPGVLAYVNNTTWLNGTKHVTIVIDPAGFVTISLNGVPVINNVQLPASYLAANRSTWTHVFKARTGAISELHAIDNLVIKYNAFEYSINGPGGPWQASNAFNGLPVGSYSVWVRNPSDTTCTTDLGIFVLDYPDSINTLATDTQLCISGTSTLSMSPLLAGATYQWDSSDVSSSGPWFPISGATAATYLANISATTWYRCNISCAGTPIVGSPSVVREVVVNNPQVLNPIPGTRCGIGTVDLSATPSSGATLKWYTTSTGGAPVATGNLYTTPVISTNTTYYVSATAGGGGSSNVASPTVGVSTFYTATVGWGLRFTVNTACDINSVNITASGTAGPATMQIRITDLADVVLYSGPVHAFNITSTLTSYTIPVNITMPPGNYKMQQVSTGITALVREASGVTFPYNSPGGELAITAGANGTGTAQTTTAYYWFYNWVISTGCESGRTAVLATVTPAPLVSVTPSTSICEGDNITLTASSVNDPNYDYTWEPGGFTGGSINVSPSATTTYTLTAIDNSAGVNNNCQDIQTVTITVSQRPVINSLTSSPAALCQGDSAQISLTAVPFIPPGGNYTVAPISFAPLAPTGTVTTLVTGGALVTPATSTSLDDNTWANIPIGFNFNFYGQTKSALSVSTNGFITFTAASTLAGCCAGQVLPSATTPNDIVAMAWEDWNFGTAPQGTLDYFTNGVAPFRQFVIRATGVSRHLATGAPTTAMIVLNETYNTIDMHLTSVTAGPSDLTTQGIENSTGTLATVVPGRNSTSWAATNEGWKFSPPVNSSLTYAWSPASGLSSSTVQNPKAAPNSNTIYTVTVSETGTGCSSTATLEMFVSPLPQPFLQEGDSVLCSNDLGFDMHVLDAGAYSGGYPSGTQFNFYGAGAILYQTGTSNVFFNQNNSDAFYVEVILPSYLGGCTALTDTSVIDFGSSQAPQYLLSTDSVKCYGESNGNAIVNITFGGSPDFRYQWYDSGMNNLLRDTTATGLTDSLKGVPQGMYVVVITDHQGATVSPYCSVTDSVYVGQPEAPLSVSENMPGHVNVLCNGNSTGAIDIDVAGGTSPYSYLWSNGAVTEDLAAVGAGTYSCSIADSRGCTTSITVIVTEPTALALNPVVNQIPCNGGTGSVTLNVTGGVGPYSVIWSNGNITQSNSNLLSGTYDVTVTDANGCTINQTFEINTEPAVLSVVCTSTNNTCYQSNNGTVNVTASGGTSPYSYLWSNGSTSSSQSSLPKGAYSVTVTDANGCSAVCATGITQPAALVVTYTSVNPTSALPSTGSITVNVTGGTAGYTYQWNNGSTLQNRTGLTAGVYTVTVTDQNGCTASKKIGLTVNCLLSVTNQIVQQASCGKSNGIATVTPSGGTSYTYAWQTSPVQTTATATGLAYYYNSYVLITDASGCTLMDTVVMNVSNGLTLSLTSPVYAGGKNIRCNGGSDGSINLTVSGSTGPYTYLWNTGATTQNLTGLSAGTYIVTVSNGGCTNSNLITLTQPTLLATTTSSTNASCAGLGSATVSASGGVSPYSYSWNTVPVKTTASVTGLVAGSYTVTVSDANGCTRSSTVVITSGATGLTVTGVVTNVSCSGGTNGKITLTTTGGTGPYTYLWSNGSTVKNQTLLAAGVYTVTATDSKGCTGTYSGLVSQPTAIAAIISFQTNVSCYGGTNGSATVAVSGGTPAYTYSWNTIPVQTTATATGLKKGTYTVTITDSKGCLKGVSVIITQPAVINISISKVNVSTYGGNNGSATANVTGGVSPYGYSWNTVPVKTTQTASGLIAGTYTVTVTDANGCTKTKSVTITQPLARVIGGSQMYDNAINSVVYPNPTSGKFTVSFDETIRTKVNLQVFSMPGERLLDRDLEVSEQSSSFDVDLSGLSKGLYFIRYRTNDKDWIERLIIQ